MCLTHRTFKYDISFCIYLFIQVPTNMKALTVVLDVNITFQIEIR